MSSNYSAIPFYDEAFALFHNHLFINLIPYFAITVMAFLICQTLFFSDPKKGKPRSNALFLGICIFALFFFRSLAWYAGNFNADEALQLTNAVSFINDRRLWYSCDPTTVGPFTFLPVVWTVDLLRCLGIDCEVNFWLGRLVVAALLSGVLLLLNKIIINKLSLKLTRILLIFFVFYFSFCYDANMFSYNWEFIYLFFLALIILLIEKYHHSNKTAFLLLFGLLCGLMPYIKLHTVPMVAVCGLWMLYLILKTDRNRIKNIVFLAISSVLPTLFIVAHLLTIEDGISTAKLFYIENSQVWVVPMLSWQYLWAAMCAGNFFLSLKWYSLIFVPAGLSIVFYCFSKNKKSVEYLFPALLMIASIFALVRTTSSFVHYVLFMSVPSIYLFSVILENNPLLGNDGKYRKYVENSILFLWVILFISFFGNVKRQTELMSNDGFIYESYEYKKLKPVTDYIVQNTDKEDYIVVFGYTAKLYIFSNRKSATAQVDAFRLWGAFSPKNAEKYLADIKRNKPELIVDISNRMWVLGAQEDQSVDIESNQIIWDGIKNDYQLVQSFDLKGDTVIIYKRVL